MCKRVLYISKKILASCLVMIFVIGFAVSFETVSATDSELKVEYMDMTQEFNDKWNNKGSATAPIKSGYLFGGWFQKTGENDLGNPIYTALTDEEASKLQEQSLTTGVYAKFVPEYVLSVKAQNEAGTKANNGNSSIRVISSIDSLDYQKVGFEILLNNKVDLSDSEGALETTRVYSSLKIQAESSDEKDTTVGPKDIFGDASNYLSVWRLDNIKDANDQKIINVRPYWITKDGTKVEGLAKYVHVEDGYNNYVSVPINLTSGANIAAGELKLLCSDSRFTFYDYEQGMLFGEMNVKNTIQAVRLVGNLEDVNQDAYANGIYANVRFKLKSGQTYNRAQDGSLIFHVKDATFCDWNEKITDISKQWDIQY